jgi:hypothetical protein
MLKYTTPKTVEQLISSNLLVRCLAGSKSYGTNTPTSDTDYRGIFYVDPVNLITPFYTVGEATAVDEEDTKYYELSKFLKLYLDCNPNIVELLWVDETDIQYAHPEYWVLRKHRHKLLSSKAAFTFTGYASAQLKRIKGHNKWISNPKPEEQPRQIDYVSLVHNFTDEKLFKIHLSNYHQGYRLVPYDGNLFGVYQMDGYETYDRIGNLNTLYDSEEHLFTQDGHRRMPLFIVKFNKDHYNQEKDEWSNYWRWKRNRNEKRSELEELYGFDCYSSDTEFLTDSGWKLFDDINSTELLATFNTNTHKIEYERYIERFDGTFTGNMYNFTGYHQDILVTPNHKMYNRPVKYLDNTPTSMDWEFTDAAKMHHHFNFLNVITPKQNRQKPPKEFPNIVSKELGVTLLNYLRIMGWFISDGTCMFNNKKEIYQIAVSQSKPQSKLTQTLTKQINYGKIPCFRKDTLIVDGNNYPEHRWYFPSNISKKIYNDCGHGSHKKRIPNWVFSLTKREMTTLLIALIQGDGTEKNYQDKTYVYYTCNSKLADDVQRLAFLCGYKTTKWGPHVGSSQFGNGEFTGYQVFIHMSADSEKTYNNITNITKISVNNERIVCFMVPNHTLVTRRNGKIALQGNCKHAMHLIRLMRMGLEILRDEEVIVKRPDAQELLSIRNGAWSYEEVVEYANQMDAEIRGHWYQTTKLPKKPNVKLAGQLLFELQSRLWEPR